MQVNPHIITLYYIIQLYIFVFMHFLNKSYQKTCSLGIQVMWLHYLLKPQKQHLILGEGGGETERDIACGD